MKSEDVKNFGIGLGVGIVAGVIIGLLFAPQKGSETRKLIKEKTKEGYSKVRGAIKNAKETVETLKFQSPITKNIDKVHNK